MAKTVLIVAVTFALPTLPTLAMSTPPRTDLGIVCLDNRTGRLLWEYFPKSLGNCELATDGHVMYVIERPRRWHLMDPMIDATNTIVTHAFDMDTLEPVDHPILPARDRLTLQLSPRRALVTKSGFRVAGSPRSDRVISVLRRGDADPDEIVRVINTEGRYSHIFVHDNLVIYAPPQWNPNDGEPAPDLVAVNAITGAIAWTLTVDRQVLGIGQGSKHLLVCDHEGLSLVEASNGKVVWRTVLPRVLGGTTVVERDGSIYVACSYPSGALSYYLYCVDLATGQVRWTYDQGGSDVPLSVLVHGDRVYTQIAPTQLFQRWRGNNQDAVRFFLSKSAADMEFYLRAWHRLGDRNALFVMESLLDKIADSGLRKVTRELIRTFPRHRDPLAFIRHLKDRYEQSPEFSAQVSELLEHFHPVPGWLKVDEIGIPPRKLRKIPLTAKESELIESYRSLRARVDPVAAGPLNRAALFMMWFNGTQISYATLMDAYDASEDVTYRTYLLPALFRQYPHKMAAWADDRFETLTEYELKSIVRWVAVGWLEARPGHLAEWLGRCNSLSLALADRLNDIDKELSEQLCVDHLAGDSAGELGTQLCHVDSCLSQLGRLDACRRHAALFDKYLASTMSSRDVMDRYGEAEIIRPRYRHRKAAAYALKACGIEREVVIDGPEELVGPPEDREILQTRRKAREWYRQMQDAQREGRTNDARHAARRVIELLNVAGVWPGLGQSFRADALLVLGRWSELIAERRSPSSWTSEQDLLEILTEANRHEELTYLVTSTDDPVVARDGAFALIEIGKVNEARQILLCLLKNSPNDVKASIGLAKLHATEGQWTQSEAMLDRAIMLRPDPSDAAYFQQTITVWIDRGEADRARDWVKKSATHNYDSWLSAGLFDGAMEWAELGDTVNEVRATMGDPPFWRRCAAIGVVGILTIFAVMRLRKKYRVDRSIAL